MTDFGVLYIDFRLHRDPISQFDHTAHSTAPISRSDPKVVGQTAF